MHIMLRLFNELKNNPIIEYKQHNYGYDQFCLDGFISSRSI